jgi:hypothetical protein
LAHTHRREKANESFLGRSQKIRPMTVHRLMPVVASPVSLLKVNSGPLASDAEGPPVVGLPEAGFGSILPSRPPSRQCALFTKEEQMPLH